MKKKHKFGYYKSNVWRKTLKVMKLTTILILFAVFSVTAKGFGQGSSISLKMENVSLKDVFMELTAISDYTFVYSENAIAGINLDVLELEEATFQRALDLSLEETGLAYYLENNVVVIHKMDKMDSVIAPKEGQEKKKELKGTVSDVDGNPLPGVSVVVKGTTNGVPTDINGNYSIQFKTNNAVLIFSFVGMISQELVYRGQVVENITLLHDSEKVDEVIVTGFQSISKERATGSYVRLSGDLIHKRPVSDITETFIGVTPGVTGREQHNGDTRFRIRGQGTFTSFESRDPLLVIDGYTVEGYRLVDFFGSSGPFGNIDPNDVESITFLKDAAATSIYGAQAANGVIVITTKSAKAGEKMNINLSSFVNIGEKLDLDYLTNMADTKTQIEFDELVVERYPDRLAVNSSSIDPYKGGSFLRSRNEHRDNIFALRAGAITQEEYDNRRANLISRDGKWKDQYDKYILRNQVLQQHSLSLSGSSKKHTYKFTGMYQKDLTSLRYNKNERLIFGFTNTYKLNKKFKFRLGANLRTTKNANNLALNRKTIKESLSPYSLLLDDNGDYVDNISTSSVNLINKPYFGKKFSDSWRYNLLEDARANNNKNISKVFNMRIQAGLDYKIIEGLDFSLKFQYERNSTKRAQTIPQKSFRSRLQRNIYSTYDAVADSYITTLGDGSTVANSGFIFEGYTFRSQLSFDKKIGEKHRLTSLLGLETRSNEFTQLSTITYYEFNERTLSFINSARKANEKHNTIFGSAGFPYRKIAPGNLRQKSGRAFSSYFNIAYTFDHKYTLTNSMRADASNFLSKDTRSKFSPFWSVGLAWNISEESFMENVNAVDNLKLRGSLGIAGTPAGLSSQSTIPSISNRNGVIKTNDKNFAVIKSAGNPSLTWEKSRTLNLGLDFSLFRSKLYGSIEYYERLTYDILVYKKAPIYAQSTSSIRINGGKILNKGLELSLGSSLRIKDNISWNGGFTFSYNRNELVDTTRPLLPYQGRYENVEGLPVQSVSSLDIRGYNKDGHLVIAAKDGQLYTVNDLTTYIRLLRKRRSVSNGETPLNDKFYKYEGVRTPPVNIGFTNTFKIHDFTLRTIITGQFGHRINFRGDYIPSFFFRNHTKELENAWRVGDPQTPFVGFPVYEVHNPIFGNTLNLASKATSLFDRGDHIRLREIYLGYKVPSKILKKSFVRSINLYTQVKNMGTIWVANKRGLDPLYLPGTLKRPVTYTFGLKLDI